MRCWLWHKWNDYESFEYDDDVDATYLARLFCKGLMPYIPTLQIRTCSKCGKTESHDFRTSPALHRGNMR